MNEKKSRVQNSILNIITTSFTSIISLFVSFANRVIFLHFLNATYLGVSGLFSNILLIFSLVELGIGAALTQMFYKPFAEKDYVHLSQITYTTKVLLNIIGVIIIVLTIIFTPLLELFVNDINAVPHMRMIFFLYGISSAVTYFYGYYRTIITANQQAYKLIKIDVIWKIVTMCAQGIALWISRNFIVYLIVQIILNFLLNIVIMIYVKKEIPQIDYNRKEFIHVNERKALFKNVAGLSMSRIAVVITNGTDNILISKFLNLVTVGLASNYVMIQQSVNSLVESIFGPLLASIGNLCATEDDNTQYLYFHNLTFASFWIYGFCSICMFILSDPFIRLIFGEDYVIPELATFFLSINIFLSGLYRVALLFRTAQGLFWYGKFRPLIQSVINLIVSLILVKVFGELWTIYAGTVISIIAITVWYEPYVVLKYGLKKTPWHFYRKMLFFTFIYFVALFLVRGIILVLPLRGVADLLVSACVCVVVINGIFAIFLFKTKEFQYWMSFLKSMIRKKRLKR